MAMTTTQALSALQPLFPVDVELYVKPCGDRWEFGYLAQGLRPGSVHQETLAYEASIEKLVELVRSRVSEKCRRIEQGEPRHRKAS